MEHLLQQTFGFSAFRLGQKEVVTHLSEGHNAAAIFPTGSGKSLCYQFPATQLPNLTLVVSPLLALMQDQLAFLHSKGVKAASIDSTQSREQANDIMQGVRDGEIKVLMISVERLNNERFRQFLHTIAISLLVVDEAHCISEWGHNFRPDYLKLPHYQRQFNIAQTLLLTATATSNVVKDMGEKFAIAPQHITLTGFYRANLYLGVTGVNSQDKIAELTKWLQPKQGQCGIVYVTLQKTAEEVAQQLQDAGFDAVAYHAGLDHQLRSAIVDKFMQSSSQIIVATIAFGMGIDKSDIRFVGHFDMPKSIENYAQEIGRAGRDGQPADCLVLANKDNLNVLENFVYGDTPEADTIGYILEQINQAQGQWEMMETSLANQANIRPLTLKTLLVYLELLGVIKPRYSYFAEYKYKCLLSKEQILAKFSGERASFIQSIFECSSHAKLWSTLDFDKLTQTYGTPRERVLSALDYLEQHQALELQTKQMTQVVDVLEPAIDVAGLTSQLTEKFLSKEKSEIARINYLLDFFVSPRCLSQSLAQYFSDNSVPSSCGHCSVCSGHVALMPAVAQLAQVSAEQFSALSSPIIEHISHKTNQPPSAVTLSRFLCGLHTPLFTRVKARSVSGFGRLEHYPFAQVRQWSQSLLGTHHAG